MRVVVLGVGNILLSDEGIGVRAIEALEARYALPEQVEVVDGGTTGMELLWELADADVVIMLDAVRAGMAPGGVVKLTGEQVPAFFKTKLSPHQIGLTDVLATLVVMERSPGKVVLIGVQPESLETSLDLSATVAASLDQVLALVVEELTALGLAPRLLAPVGV